MFKLSCKVFAVIGVAASLICSTILPQAFAADYPKRSVNLIVPFSAGGGCDLVARNFANTLEKYLGKPIVVSNRDGGGGTIGASYVAKARPDGYTMLLTVIGPVLIQPLYGSTDYTRADLRPLANLVRIPTMIVLNKNLGIKNFDEFMARVNDKNSKPLTISVASAKGLPHLAVAAFISKANGANIKIMPYKGANPAVAAVLGGHVDGCCVHPSEALPHTGSGDFIPIAVFSSERIPEYPNTPTFKELGYDVCISVWRGLALPAKTPDSVVNILEAAIAKTVKDPAYIEGLKKIGENYDYLDAKATGKMWENEGPMIEKTVKDLGLYMINKR